MSMPESWNSSVAYGFQDGAQSADLSYSYDKTDDTGTSALPMDIRYVDTHALDTDWGNSIGAFDIEAKVHYLDTDHKIDNYTLRQAPQLNRPGKQHPRSKGSLNNNHPFWNANPSRPTALRKGLHTMSMRPFARLDFGFLRRPTSCMTYMDVGNADIAGADICPCSRCRAVASTPKIGT